MFYFVYFSVMGLMLPFFPVYLAALNMNAMTIGFMVGLLSAARMLAPPLFGHFLDQRKHAAAGVLSLAACLAAIAFLPLNHAVPWLPLFALLVLLFSMLWAGMLPAADGLTLVIAEQQGSDYSRIRAWGSLGFIASSMLAGFWLKESTMHYFPWIIAFLMFLLAISSSAFRPSMSFAPIADKPDRPILKKPWSQALRRLMLGGLLMQCSHGAYYGFFSLYLIELGFSNQTIGILWVVGVVAEIVLMAYGGKWLQKLPLSVCLRACFLLAALRWLGIGMVEDYWLLFVFQLLHAASFAAFHIASVTGIARIAPASQQVSTQGWFAAMGFGLGGMLGIVLAGWVVNIMHIQMAFLLSSLIALAGVYLYRK
ncbi:MAG: MFS transporter [Mariprofundaceae bacterium]|nr:MFS transporter [Mariprofundaceae bacterium]